MARYPGLEEDIRAALEGLELVHGLLGLGSATGSGSGRRGGLDHRIESGRRIAGYRVVRELGRGGMGTVYEAVHVGLDRPVALKVLGVHAAPDSSARRRFLNEARTAAGLHHTHIVPVFDVGQVGGLCYYAMQRIEGSGLDRVLKHLRRTRQVASGVGEAISGSRLPKLAGTRARAGLSPNPHGRAGCWGRLPASLAAGAQQARWLARSRSSGRCASSGGFAASRLAPTARDRSVVADGSTASWGTGASRSRSPDARQRSAGLLGGRHGAAAGFDRRRARSRPRTPASRRRSILRAGRLTSAGWPRSRLESADALAHAHQQGVIHRDVKPSNLLIDAKGSIWVTDFGLARRLADPGITHHDSLLGTPRYMSPEQARTGTIDGRTDVYSLGATLYELLTLRPPFDGQTAAELIDQIGQQEPLPPTKIDRRVPRDLETIALKALAKRPADRYATAAELFEDLGRFLNREPVKARRIGPIGRIWRVARRHPGITAVSTRRRRDHPGDRHVCVFEGRLGPQRRRRGPRRRASRRSTAERAQRQGTCRPQGKPAIDDRAGRPLRGAEPAQSGPRADQKRRRASIPTPQQRTELRDWAVKFLVLREIEAEQARAGDGKVARPGLHARRRSTRRSLRRGRRARLLGRRRAPAVDEIVASRRAGHLVRRR